MFMTMPPRVAWSQMGDFLLDVAQHTVLCLSVRLGRAGSRPPPVSQPRELGYVEEHASKISKWMNQARDPTTMAAVGPEFAVAIEDEDGNPVGAGLDRCPW